VVNGVYSTEKRQRSSNCSVVLTVLLAAQFLVGGGFASLFFGVWAIVVGIWISSPLTSWKAHLSFNSQRLLAKLWPWTFIAFLLLSSVDLEITIFGYNPSLLNILFPFLILGFPLLIVESGIAFDIQRRKAPSNVEG
jgi:hypothetical protein